MTKSEFLQKLAAALSHLPGGERSRVLEYYEEMIDDRMESGMSETEAIDAMGSIEEILKEAAPEALHASLSIFEESQSQHDLKFIVLREPVQSLDIANACVDLNIVHASLPEGITARVDYNLSENEQCLCTLSNGKLDVRYKKNSQKRFSFLSLFSTSGASITITLSSAVLVDGDVNASSGNVSMSGLVFTGSLNITTASGDIDAQDVAVQNNSSFCTASGDIAGNNLTCGDLLEIHTSSGDIELKTVKAGTIDSRTVSGDYTLNSIQCDQISLKSTSGDSELSRINSGKLSISTVSGDITLHEADADSIDLSSTSGDLKLRYVQSNKIYAKSVSGDIGGILIPAGEYSIHTRSRSGDVKAPQTNGQRIAELQTVSGDIRFHDC